ncbi:MAG: Gfo/Idh/MocA family protein [Bryobacteraceae bacterium]
MNRRTFLTMQTSQGGRPLRLGFVGVGDRGSYHLDVLLGMDSVEVKALCDIDEGYLYRARKWVVDAGKPAPEIYSGTADYLRLCERNDIDLVVNATPWQFHAPVCVAAMRAGKHATTEVPAAITLDECWEMVETSEKTGKHCIMLEQSCYNPERMAVMNMAQQGVFGELLHATGGYVHDLRLVKFDPEREPWRLQHSIDRNGNNYPTHSMGPISWWLNINHGDRIEYLVSMSTKARCLNDYAAHYYGDRHPYASMKMACGDVNTTLLRTAKGRTITLHHDTNTPHPQTSELRLQGTRGLFLGNLNQIYIEGRSPKEHEWEPFAKYAKEYQHPVWKDFDEAKFKKSRGHGGGATTPMLWKRLLEALRTGGEPDQNVYDAVTWSAVSPLTERSVAAKSRPVDFPDFTRGKWKNSPVLRLV